MRKDYKELEVTIVHFLFIYVLTQQLQKQHWCTNISHVHTAGLNCRELHNMGIIITYLYKNKSQREENGKLCNLTVTTIRL
jgi:hypothetical protein